MGIISKHCRKLVMEILFQLLLKGCTIEARLRNLQYPWHHEVSVVVERMYDWSFIALVSLAFNVFQLLLKGCTIEASPAPIFWKPISFSCCWKDVRLKLISEKIRNGLTRFSCCWKDVRLKRRNSRRSRYREWWFQLLLKGCTIEASHPGFIKFLARVFQLLLKGCTIEANAVRSVAIEEQFQLLLKGCTIEAIQGSWKIWSIPVSVVVERMYDWSSNVSSTFSSATWVSVVVERMYDWSSETNWLKTNDFWQLVSDLFFENGRSAQKVPLFSKIWGDLGDCLTVFDSCSNI